MKTRSSCCGYLSKSATPQETKESTLTVLNGGRSVPQTIEAIADNSHQEVAKYLKITPKQLKVLKCIQRGCSTKVIAHELGIAESTASTHLKNIFNTLGAHNRTASITKALNLHLL